MKIIFLSNFYPRSKRDYYYSRSKSGLAAAADAHQYALALGLKGICESLIIINSPSIFPYPFHYKDISISSEKLQENGLLINNIGFSTILGYQFVSRYKNIYARLKQEVEKTEDLIYILVYATNVSFMKAATKIRSKYKNVRINLIVPDLPEDMETHSGIMQKLIYLIRRVYFKKTESYYKQFDSFVLLTKYMKDKIGCPDDSYIVSEGIYEESVTKRIPHQEDPHVFKIFYGGMLHKRYGIMNLLDAFRSIENDNIILQLCGNGDCVDKILEYAKIDSRICYLGLVRREESLDYQSTASLLINPRIPDNNPFTKYSFPSKTMEYLASGTPTLIYQLDGIPDEYYKYCYSLDANHTNVVDLSSKIIEIMNTPMEQRLTMAIKARKFILEKKNQRIVCKSIYEFLKNTI